MYGQRARLPVESLLSGALLAHERVSADAENLANKIQNYAKIGTSSSSR